jgi:hypothetical protein
MDNFGGGNGMFGDLVNIVNRSALALRDAPSFGGVGISMEGTVLSCLDLCGSHSALVFGDRSVP